MTTETKAPKAAKKLEKTYNVEAGTFSFQVAGQAEIVGSIEDFPAEIVKQLALHGLMQKGGDAISAKDCVGEPAYKMISGVVSRLAEGKFGATREGGNGAVAIYIEAMSRITGRTIEECAAVVDVMDEARLKQVKADGEVKAVVAEIRAERAKAKLAGKAADTDAPSLSELMQG